MRVALTIVCLLGAGIFTGGRSAAAESSRTGLLQFLDGSSLHGSLNSIEQTNGLVWNHPAARQPLQFFLTNISTIRFEGAEPAASTFKPACRFHFKNGDQVIGNIRAIKDQKIQLETWFGEAVEADLSSLEAIMFSTRGYNLIYEGPSGVDGWKIGRNPRSWEYRDGAFIANGADLLGRDFGLTGSSSIEFDLQWTGTFSLSITLYAQVIDRFDYSTSAYLVYLGTGSIHVQRVQAGAGAVMLGQTQIPEMFRRNKMHFEIRCNKEDATISIFADGKFVQRWKDASPGGFVAKGGGVVFFSQVEPRGLKLSNIRVAEWDGRFEPESLTNAPTDMDVIYLANRDKVLGELQQLDGGKVKIESRQASLEIPISRITQIRFAGKAAEPAVRDPQEVRAHFPGGEVVSFELQRWSAEAVTGRSKIFGDLSFRPATIRQLQFNLQRAPALEQDSPTPDLDFPEFE